MPEAPHAGPDAAREIADVDLLYVNIAPGPNGALEASTVVRDRSNGRVYEIPGGPVHTVTARDILTNPVDDEEG